ncbi:MAG: hypothetical protein GKS06_02130 [Acidobacteria bacterium]|nr:hypothetical protein [Acidobacteriota bacterium]
MRSITAFGLLLLLMCVALPVAAQDIGAWEIVYASDDELLLLVAAAELQANFRPLMHLHCKKGAEPRVFFRPFVEDVRMQFDDKELFVSRFGDISYGFAIDVDGSLVEEGRDADRRPMRAFTNSAELIAGMLRHERLLVRFQRVNAAEIQSRSYERNWFVLPGLGTIFDALGNPCLAE